jgi:hypothetical protein
LPGDLAATLPARLDEKAFAARKCRWQSGGVLAVASVAGRLLVHLSEGARRATPTDLFSAITGLLAAAVTAEALALGRITTCDFLRALWAE